MRLWTLRVQPHAIRDCGIRFMREYTLWLILSTGYFCEAKVVTNLKFRHVSCREKAQVVFVAAWLAKIDTYSENLWIFLDVVLSKGLKPIH